MVLRGKRSVPHVLDDPLAHMHVDNEDKGVLQTQRITCEGTVDCWQRFASQDGQPQAQEGRGSQ